MNPLVAICLCAFALASGCKAKDGPNKIVESSGDIPVVIEHSEKTDAPSQQAGKEKAALELAQKIARQKGERWISKEKAVSIANKEFLKTHESLNGLSIITCETAWTWMIVYDGSGLEYVLNKGSGKFYGTQATPHEAEESNQSNQQMASRDNGEVSRDEAALIANRDFRESLRKLDIPESKSEQYNIFTCELAKVWRVYVQFRELPGQSLPNAHAPNYVIDKKSGKLIYKQFVY